MCTETSKRQEGSLYKNSYPKFFKTTNFDKFRCETLSWIFKNPVFMYTETSKRQEGVRAKIRTKNVVNR